MFSATLSKEIRPVCKKFMQDVITQSSSSLRSTIAPASLAYSCPGQSSSHTININVGASAGQALRRRFEEMNTEFEKNESRSISFDKRRNHMLDTRVQHNISLLLPILIPSLNSISDVSSSAYTCGGEAYTYLSKIESTDMMFERSELEFQSIVKSFNQLLRIKGTTHNKDNNTFREYIEGEKKIGI